MKSGPLGGSFSDFRQEREYYKAQREKLKFKSEAGKLIDKKEVESTCFEAARAIRDTLQAVPGRIAPLMPAITEEKEALKVMTEEINLIPAEMAEGFKI